MDDKRIDRLLEQVQQNRARFLVSLQKTQEIQKEMRENPKEVEKRVGNLETMMLSLINVTLETSETIKKVGEKVDILTATQKETDERLNATLLMAEKYFSRNNGKSGEK